MPEPLAYCFMCSHTQRAHVGWQHKAPSAIVAVRQFHIILYAILAICIRVYNKSFYSLFLYFHILIRGLIH